jgi:hypothetical protein
LNHLINRLSSSRDPLLLKIIRNISAWTFNQQQTLENPELQYKLRGLWSPHLKVLMYTCFMYIYVHMYTCLLKCMDIYAYINIRKSWFTIYIKRSLVSTFKGTYVYTCFMYIYVHMYTFILKCMDIYAYINIRKSWFTIYIKRSIVSTFEGIYVYIYIYQKVLM